MKKYMVQGTIGSVVDKSKMFTELTEKNKAQRVAALVDAVAVARASLLANCSLCGEAFGKCVCYDENKPDIIAYCIVCGELFDECICDDFDNNQPD